MSLSAEIHVDGDDDSLFGSPPSSPTRGRSPSPLALPSGPAQNVGTLALPGSHLVAELPVTPPVSLPLTASAPAPSRQSPSHPPPPRIPSQSIVSSSRRNSARVEPAPRKSRKGKEKETSTTPRPTPPPISLPAADETVPPHFLRNQQALLGLAGMVGGVNPANLPKPRDTRGTTAEDPIVVEEEPSLPQQPSIGKRPVRPGPEQILGSLLQQKNVFPVVVSLLRLLAPGAPSLASVPPSHPYYPYPQQYTPPQTTPSFWTRSQSPEQAADWDVPYPFQEGQGPENYRTNWERERSKQLLADLVQLVKGAAQKAATKTWYQQQQSQRRYYGRGVVVGYGPEPTVNKYYRPKTMYYGLERAPVPPQRPYYPHPAASYAVPAYHTFGTSTPSTSVACGSDAGLPHDPPSSASPHDQAQSTQEVPQLSPTAFDQLVESLLNAQQQQEQQVADTSVDPASTPKSASSPAASSSFTSEDNTQALFDNWLEMLTAFPPGDPDECSAASPTSPVSSADVGATSSGAPTDSTTSPVMTDSAAEASSQIPDCLIDPALLDLAFSDITQPSPTTSAAASASLPASSSIAPNSEAAAAVPAPSASVQSATPSLVDSPTVTTASLADPADAGPATPTWDWTFTEGHEETATDMKKTLEEWARMDVDVDMGAIIDEQLAASAVPAPTVDPSTSATEVPAAPQLGVDAQMAVPVDPEPPQLRAPVHSGPSLPQEDALRQGLGAQDASQLTLQHGAAGMTPQPTVSPSIPPSFPHLPAQLSASTALGVLPASFVSSVAHAMATSARAKGKARAISGTGNGVGAIPAPGGGAKQERKAVLERARKMRAALAAEVERAKVALWETTLEQGVLVGFGRELEKEERGR
ncbi:hypothetical protein C8T65DRAFT_636112 [Cerioporus squamosus]|nr:hypothetical protein C8T65DRAFT_636112 [Cerioporus squamosus]